MKVVFVILFFIFSGICVFANDVDLEQVYRDLPVPTHSYVHNIDPDEAYDMRNTAWSPYPLFRLTAPLFFKNIMIEPGYYLLTPRKHQDNWYMLFKVQGKIKYIIPIYKKETTPLGFYEENLPQPKLTWSQKKHLNFLKFVGERFDESMREPIKQNFLEIFDLENNFISLVVYWGDYKYYMILRSIAL